MKRNIFDVYKEFYLKFHGVFPYIYMCINPDTICVECDYFGVGNFKDFTSFFESSNIEFHFSVVAYNSSTRLLIYPDL